jgi:CBS domain-containing protein
VATVREAMSGDLVTIEPSSTMVGAAGQMATARMLFGGFRHLPVVDGSKVVGVISMRDLARRLSTD